MNDLIEEIFARARAKAISKSGLADKSGIRPETLSRLVRRDDCDLMTLRRLALAVGCRLALVPLSQDDGDAVYDPRDHARAKARSRRRDEEDVQSRRASREEVQRRGGFFSLPRATFAIKGLRPTGR